MLEHHDQAGTAIARLAPRYNAASRVGEDDGSEEKIGIARITLKQPQRGVSALVAGFFEADRLLLVWKSNARKTVDCEFTVSFTDGASLRGTLALWCKARGRPSLWATIRQALRLTDKERRGDIKRVLVDQYGHVVDEAILENYAVDKHPYDVTLGRSRER